MRSKTSLHAELFARALRMGILGVFALVVAVSILSLFHPTPTSAATSSTLNFQARLETATGAIVPDGNYNVEFKLYNTSTVTGTPDQGACTYNGGTTDPNCLWVETRTSTNQVRVANGYLTVNLGSVTAFPTTMNWNQQLWLTMRIGGTGTPSWDAEMSPRLQLTAVPYAFQAGALGNGTNQAVLDSSGNLVFQQASTVKELSATTGTALTIQGGAATSGTNVGGNLLLQGGAGASTGASGSVIVKPAGNDSTTAFEVQNAAGTTTLLDADTTNLKVSVTGNIANLFSSTPGLVQLSSTTTSATNPIWVAVQGKYAYVVEQGGTATLEILDITNASAPVSVGTLALNATTPNQIQVQGRYAYIAEQGASNAGKLQIIDVSNPHAPVSVSALSTGTNPGPFGVYVSGNYAYVTDSNTNDLAIVNISNPAAPSVVSTITTNTSPRKVYVQGRYAYVVSSAGTSKLQVIDISNPASPSITGSLTLNQGGMGISVQGRYAYISEWTSNGQIEVVDVSNPALPTSVYVSPGANDEESWGNVVAGRYFFTDSSTNGVAGIAVHDISAPSSPTVLQTYTTGLTDPRGLFVDGRYLLVANRGAGKLTIVDMSGLETTSAVIHSLEAGTLNVDTNASVANNFNVGGGVTVGQGGIFSAGGISAYGPSVFGNAIDSSTAFQIQNAAGSNILSVGTASIGSITTNANSFTAVEQEASAISNGYAYVVAGTTTGAAAGGVSTVQYAKVNSDGSVGTWSTTSALPAARSYGSQTAPVWNGYIYYAGGYNTSGTAQSTVYYAKLNTDGTVGAWNTTTSLATGGPGAIAEGDMVAANGYLYWIGGYNGTSDVATSYYAKINADGTVGSWTSTGITLPSSISDFQAVVANGYIYTVGGWMGSADTNDIFSAKLNSNGTLTGTAGNWYTPSNVSGNSLPGTGLNDASAAVVNGYLYVVAGANGGGGPGTKVTYGFPLPADGSSALGTRVTQTGQLAANRWKGSTASANGYMYYFGGDSGTGSTASGTVYYSSTTRVSIAGDLDLVGLTTSSLSGQSSGGGTIYAGSIHSIGNLSVQGNASLRSGLNVNGAAVIRDNANSTATFQVQNSSSANLFTVDTTNNAIVLGNDGTPSLLTIRGGVAAGSNVQGSNITFDASNGTGVSGSGDFIFRTAAGDSSSVTYDNSAKVHDPGAPGTSQTISNFAVGNHTNRLLLVAVTDQNYSLAATTGVTFGGSNLTFLDAQNCPTGGFNPSCHIELWYMLNPAISTGNIVATVAGGASDYVDVAAVSYYNVNQSTPFGTETHNSGFNSSPTTNSVTSNTTQLVFDALGSDGSGITSSNTSGATVRQINNGGVVENAIQDKPGLSGTTSMGWVDASADWMELTVPINPIVDSSSDTLSDRLHITAAGNVGINTASPQHTLDVTGTENVTGALSLGTASSATGTLVFDNAGGANTVTIQSGTTSASYTLTLPTAVGAANQCLQAVDGVGTLGWSSCGGSGSGGVSLQAATPGTPDTGNFNISGTGIAATLYASTFDAASSVALNIGNSNASSINIGKTGSNIATTINGTALFKTTAADSTTAFQIQNASGRNLFTVDTSNSKVGVGISVPSNSLSVSPLDYQTGTVTRTNSSATLVGTGTTWTSSMVGDIIVFADGTTNTVSAFTDATHITMGTTYTGTTDASPVSYRFHLIGLQVTSTGNVGIGTTNPTQTLYVSTNSNSSTGIHVVNANTGASAWSQLELATSAQQYNIGVGGSGTSMAGTLGVFDQTNSKFRLVVTSSGNVGVGGITNPSYKLAIQGSSASTAAAFEGLLQLNASDGQIGEIYHNNNGTNSYLGLESYNVGNTTKTPIVLQEYGGNVGIGTNAPGNTLQVNGTFWTQGGNFQLDDAGVNDSTAVRLFSSGGNLYLQDGSGGNIYFRNKTAGTIMDLQDGGNLGIGTTGPNQLLSVAGAADFGYVSGVHSGIFVGNETSYGNNPFIQGVSSGWGAQSVAINPTGGSVGIGTTAPGHELTVQGNTGGKIVGFTNLTTSASISTGIVEIRGGWGNTSSGSRYLQFYSGATSDTNGTGEGSVDAISGGVSYNTSTADFGEYFTLLNTMDYGDIAVSSVDSSGAYGVTKGTSQNADIVGVLSDTAGFVGNTKYDASGTKNTTNRDVVGLMGQIKTHVSDINGAIHAGDPITISDIPGFGAKATAAGQIVGRAMEDFDPAAGSIIMGCPASTTSGVHCGTIMVLVHPSWYDPSAELAGKLQGGNFASLNVTGDLTTYILTVSSDATFKANIIVDGHVITGGDTPLAAPQAATGIDALGNVEGACTVNGNDTSGTITLVAGFNNLASGAQCTVTFAKQFDSAPRPVVSATDKEAAGVGVYAQTSVAQMTLYFSQVPQAGQQYNFNYWNPQ